MRFPGSLLSLDKASFRYPEAGAGARAACPSAPPIVRDVSLGLNGAGKSTLVRLLIDDARPTAGFVAAHPRLKLGYYSQHAVEALKAAGAADPALTAPGLLTADVAGQLSEGDVRALLGDLGLPGRIASDMPLAKLSGGQLVRCELARLLWRRPHCLVLNEVTTHLDYETVTALRVALCHWPGAVVSHDRWFMRGAVEGNLGDDSSDSDNDEPPRRRVVYRLKGGSLTALDGGVDEFEALVKKRASKLLESPG